MKKALLIVSFGTSYPETRKKTIEAIEEKMEQAFPEYDVFRAFTSTMIIKKIKRVEGIQINTVEEWMPKLKAMGYTEVLLQPLHVINGSEYSKALHQAARYRNQFERLTIGKPLLTSFEDYQVIRNWLEYVANPLESDEALVLMGHGSDHPQFTAYACLDHMLLEQPIYICAVESYPGIETIIKRLHQDNVKKIQLYPLMIVAGDHATNDMASDEPDSWKSQLEQAGFEVSAHLKGMGEYAQIQDLFLEHAKNAAKENNN